MTSEDTIFALSSGPPPAGIAVVRVSGPGTRFGLETLIGSIPEPRRAAVHSLRFNGEVLDRGIVLFFPGPASFTGEDMAELHLHGGRAVVAAVVHALGLLRSYRAAEPGEFTRRAFLNGKLDLTQVEGMADLIAAETEAQRRQALRGAGGELRRTYEQWRGRLIKARALVEAELDFPDEEDVPGSVSSRVWGDVKALEQEIASFLAGAGAAERLRDGAEIVVLGPPNAGKSSLINALAKRDVAIVTAEPGTTRDLIEVRLDLAGYPVTLVDTAGLRKTAGLVEAEGIRRAEARARSADLILWLTDMREQSPAPPAFDARVLAVKTKLDLVDSTLQQAPESGDSELGISVVTGAGVDRLLRRISDIVVNELSPAESTLISRARHRSALLACQEALTNASADKPLELRAEDLRRAADALGRLSGRIDPEDMLDVIFREFCIGK